jgi:argininosuccinate lyase
MQEDKEALFDAIDTVKGSLAIIGGMIGNIRFDRQRMLDEASKGFSTATDLAEYLVKKGIPFRKAHEVVGRIVGDCIKMGTDLEKLDLAFFRDYAVEFEADVLGILDVRQSVNSRNIEGGTGQKSVLKRIKEIEKSGK